jgi:uncharacterized membrane protein YfcA
MEKERKEKKRIESEKAGNKEGFLSGSATSNIGSASTIAGNSSSEASMSEIDETKPRIATAKELFCKQMPNIMTLVISYLLVAVCSVLRGGHGAESVINLDSCSSYSWVMLGLCQLGLVLMIILGTRSNSKAMSYHPSLGSAIRTKTSKVKLPVNVKIVLVSYVSGILSGTLGVGGGLVINPLLMGMGFDPVTSTAMSNTSVFFSASSTTTQFIAAGAIHYQHALLFTGLSLSGAFCGNFLLAKLVKKYQKPSFIIWVVLAVLVISGIVMPVDLALTTDFTSWSKVFNFGPIC